MYGGGGYDPENQQWQQLRDIYILDFSLPKEPRWRVSSVVNSGRLSTQRTLYPNPGIVPLPQIDSLLIQSDQVTLMDAYSQAVWCWQGCCLPCMLCPVPPCNMFASCSWCIEDMVNTML